MHTAWRTDLDPVDLTRFLRLHPSIDAFLSLGSLDILDFSEVLSGCWEVIQSFGRLLGLIFYDFISVFRSSTKKSRWTRTVDYDVWENGSAFVDIHILRNPRVQLLFRDESKNPRCELNKTQEMRTDAYSFLRHFKQQRT